MSRGQRGTGARDWPGAADEVGPSAFIGHVSDFNRNWDALAAAAELTPEDIEHIHRLRLPLVTAPVLEPNHEVMWSGQR